MQDIDNKFKVYIQCKLEPIDIREIDEDSMMCTLSDENNDEERVFDCTNENKNKKSKSGKMFLFKRTKEEKKQYIDSKYNLNNELERTNLRKSKLIEKNEMDAI